MQRRQSCTCPRPLLKSPRLTTALPVFLYLRSSSARDCDVLAVSFVRS